MPKNIVFCADGTWNGPGRDLDDQPVPTLPTNVLKLYHWLAGKDTIDSMQYAGEAERNEVDPAGNVLQVAKYLDGVGDSGNWLVKMLGGVFGAGLVTRIVRGYTFISRNYVAGDRIFIVGFSRGAYTARALGGLIMEQGLLNAQTVDLDDKTAGYRLGCAAWRKHQSAIAGRKGPVEWFEQTILDLPGFFTCDPTPSQVISNVAIEALAVWDTVGAMGIPQYDGEDRRIDGFRFADLDLNAKVAYGFHAISVDEQRMDFTPTLWNRRNQVVQTLFPGAHADVGGGYPSDNRESGLSDGALGWIKTQLETLQDGKNLHFDSAPVGLAIDPLGVAHRPWFYNPYLALPPESQGARLFMNGVGLKLHDSIQTRAAAHGVIPDPLITDAEPYAPSNLPAP
jgi:hypothetical protein